VRFKARPWRGVCDGRFGLWLGRFGLWLWRFGAALAIICGLGFNTYAQASSYFYPRYFYAQQAAPAAPEPPPRSVQPKLRPAPALWPAHTAPLDPAPLSAFAPPPPQEEERIKRLVVQYSADTALDDEGNCLSSAIYYEARGEPLEGQLAVAYVVLNRARSGRFPNSLCAVILQPKQFSFVTTGQIIQPPNNEEWRTSVAISEIARRHKRNSPVGEATHYHNLDVWPEWHLERVAQIGHHVFYR
jgi:N-acetylmuramoyl-L-alanine amidase